MQCYWYSIKYFFFRDLTENQKLFYVCLPWWKSFEKKFNKNDFFIEFTQKNISNNLYIFAKFNFLKSETNNWKLLKDVTNDFLVSIC